ALEAVPLLLGLLRRRLRVAALLELLEEALHVLHEVALPRLLLELLLPRRVVGLGAGRRLLGPGGRPVPRPAAAPDEPPARPRDDGLGDDELTLEERDRLELRADLVGLELVLRGVGGVDDAEAAERHAEAEQVELRALELHFLPEPARAVLLD